MVEKIYCVGGFLFMKYSYKLEKKLTFYEKLVIILMKRVIFYGVGSPFPSLWDIKYKMDSNYLKE